MVCTPSYGCGRCDQKPLAFFPLFRGSRPDPFFTVNRRPGNLLPVTLQFQPNSLPSVLRRSRARFTRLSTPSWTCIALREYTPFSPLQQPRRLLNHAPRTRPPCVSLHQRLAAFPRLVSRSSVTPFTGCGTRLGTPLHAYISAYTSTSIAC